MELHIERLAAGSYVVNGRYRLTRKSGGAGSLYDHGTTWYWVDNAADRGARQQYFDTKKEALANLSAHLGGAV